MILKKPYAFLIKYFRIIHAVIALLLILFLLRYNSIVSFFNSYILNNYSISLVSNLANEYTPLFVYGYVIIILVLLGFIIALLLHKKKNITLYIVMFIYYSIILLGLIYITTVLNGFEYALIGSTIARAIRDVLLLLYIPQIIFIIFMIIRALGFNLKQMNFNEDIKELNLTGKDNEEFELNIDLQGYKAERKVNRSKREFIYYIKENKFLVLIISIVAIIALGIFIFTRSGNNYDSTYGENKAFKYSNLSVKVTKSMVTNTDYNGNVLDNYYFVIELNVSNNTANNIAFNIDAINLKVNNESITASSSDNKYFLDYINTKVYPTISAGKSVTFGLAYKLKSYSTNGTLVFINGQVVKNDNTYLKHIYVNLNPKVIKDSSEKTTNYLMNNSISLSDTFLGDSSINVTNYSITDKYKYEYEVCDVDCKTYNDLLVLTSKYQNKKLLVLNTEFTLDNSTSYAFSNSSLYNFGKYFTYVEYKIDKQIYTSNEIIDTNSQNNFLAYAVPNEIENASVINLVILVRNYKYVIQIKG